MSVCDWIEMARTERTPIGLTGRELYPGFLPSLDPADIVPVRAALNAAGLDMPMFCASPDFTHPEPWLRAQEVERHAEMIAASAALGGGTCRVLSGQRRPEVSRDQGIAWVVECIRQV